MVLSISRVYNMYYVHLHVVGAVWRGVTVFSSTSSFQGEPRAFCCSMSFTWKCLCWFFAQCLLHSILFHSFFTSIVSCRCIFHFSIFSLSPPTTDPVCFAISYSLFNLVLNIRNVSVLLCWQCHCCCFGWCYCCYSYGYVAVAVALFKWCNIAATTIVAVTIIACNSLLNRTNIQLQ